MRWLQTLRRDVSTVLADLRGQHPPPLIPRPPFRRLQDPEKVSASADAARPMIVRAVRKETAEATTVVLADPAGVPIRFVPGQFLTLLVTIEGVVHRRAYSICSSVDDTETVAITAKRVAGGRVSGHVHERVRVGDVIPVLGPSGEFKVAIDPEARRTLVLVAGGSGITPILAIARAVLGREPGGRVALIYGNRGDDDIIFRGVLDELAAAHGDRFAIRHVLEEPRAIAATRGRLDRATVAAELDALGDRTTGADYYVCGPAAAMAAVRDELAARGVPAARVHEERFATAERKPRASSAQRLTLRVAGRVHDVVVPPDGTILDAGLAAGVAMPYSCAMGGCGACAVELTSGEVDLDEPNCLTPDERARGRILACVARPCGPCDVALGGTP
jgi:ring-1,2-phenylacetyl-CoA epoxidase subunit PaaE